MVNEKKIRIMLDLSHYEKCEGKNELRAMRYFRSDYLGAALFKNFFLITLGYVLILLLVAVYHLEYLLNNIHTMNIILLVSVILGGYVILLAIYSVATYVKYALQYKRIKRSVHMYDRKLAALIALYEKEEKQKNQKQQNRRGTV